MVQHILLGDIAPLLLLLAALARDHAPGHAADALGSNARSGRFSHPVTGLVAVARAHLLLAYPGAVQRGA